MADSSIRSPESVTWHLLNELRSKKKERAGTPNLIKSRTASNVLTLESGAIREEGNELWALLKDGGQIKKSVTQVFGSQLPTGAAYDETIGALEMLLALLEAQKDASGAIKLTGKDLREILNDKVLKKYPQASRPVLLNYLKERLFAGKNVSFNIDNTNNFNLLNLGENETMEMAAIAPELKDALVQAKAFGLVLTFLKFLKDQGKTGFSLEELAEKLGTLLGTTEPNGVVDGGLDRQCFIEIFLSELLSHSDGRSAPASLLLSGDLVFTLNIPAGADPNSQPAFKAELIFEKDAQTGALKIKANSADANSKLKNLVIKDANKPTSALRQTAFGRVENAALVFEKLAVGDNVAVDRLLAERFKQPELVPDRDAIKGFNEHLESTKGEVFPSYLLAIWNGLKNKTDLEKKLKIDHLLKNLKPEALVELKSKVMWGTRALVSDDDWKDLATKLHTALSAKTVPEMNRDFAFLKINVGAITLFQTFLNNEVLIPQITDSWKNAQKKIDAVGNITDDAKKKIMYANLGADGDKLTRLNARIKVVLDTPVAGQAAAQNALRNDTEFKTLIEELELGTVDEFIARNSVDLRDTAKRIRDNIVAFNSYNDERKKRALVLLNRNLPAGAPELKETDLEGLRSKLELDLQSPNEDTQRTAASKTLKDPANANLVKAFDKDKYTPLERVTSPGGRPGGVGTRPIQDWQNINSTEIDSLTYDTDGSLISGDFRFSSRADIARKTGKKDLTGQGDMQLVMISPKDSSQGIALNIAFVQGKDGKPMLETLAYKTTLDENKNVHVQTQEEVPVIRGSFRSQLENDPKNGLGPIVWVIEGQDGRAYIHVVSNDQSASTAVLTADNRLTGFGTPNKTGRYLIERDTSVSQTFELTKKGEWLTEPDPTHFLRPPGGGYHHGRPSPAQVDRAEDLTAYLQSVLDSGGLTKIKDDEPKIVGMKKALQDLRNMLGGFTGAYPPGKTRQDVELAINSVEKTLSDYSTAAAKAKKEGKAVPDEELKKLGDADNHLRVLQAFADIGKQDLIKKSGRRGKDVDFDRLLEQWRAGGISFQYVILMAMAIMLDGQDQFLATTLKNLNSISLAQQNAGTAGSGIGTINSLQTEATLEQMRLQMAVSERQRLVETVSNISKADADGLHNSVRRIA